MTDEEIARKLNELELAQERRQKEERERQDEEYARKLAIELNNESNANTPSQNINTNNDNNYNNHNNLSISTPSNAITNGNLVEPVIIPSAGSKISVRLHHPSTGNYIGEIFNVSYHYNNRVQFELNNRPNVRMRVLEMGTIEYSTVFDEKALYIIDTVPNTNYIYILPEAHLNKINSQGSLSWCLQLLPDGKFIGNGSKASILSQWMLVPASTGTNTNLSNMASPIRNNNNNNNRNNNYINGIVVANSSNNNNILQRSASLNSQITATTATTKNTTNNNNNNNNNNSNNTNSINNTLQEYKNQNIIELLQLGVSIPLSIQQQWFQSPVGKKYINEISDTKIKSIFETTGIDDLHKYAYRSDWIKSASRYQDYTKLIYHTPSTSILNEKFPLFLRKEFFTQGYIRIQNIIPLPMIQQAYKLSMMAINHNLTHCKQTAYGRLELIDTAYNNDSDFLTMFYDTILIHIVTKLIGENEFILPSKGA